MSEKAPLPRERRRTTKGLRPLPELLRDVVTQLRRLVAGEIALLKAELLAKAKKAATGIGLLVAAAVLVFFALAGLVTTAVLAFALIVPAWLAALIVAGILLVLAIVAALFGRWALKRIGPVIPEETLHGLGDDLRALKGDRG